MILAVGGGRERDPQVPPEEEGGETRNRRLEDPVRLYLSEDEEYPCRMVLRFIAFTGPRFVIL